MDRVAHPDFVGFELAEAHLGALQVDDHWRLGEISAQVAHGLGDRVLAMSYSEFGRRVKENRSLGTDHGAAAPMFIAGGAIEGGFWGKHPSLADLTDGDLRHATDFRQVYATVLDRWLKTDSRAVLGKAYSPVAFL